MKNKHKMLKKSLVLDVHGVVFKEPDDFENVYLPYLKQRHRFSEEYARELYYSKLTLGRISSSDFFKLLGVPPCLDFVKELKIDPDFAEFAKTIREKFRIILLSNDAIEWAHALSSHFGLDQLVDEYITSGELHCRKPNPRAYKKLPRGSIFVDDKLENLEYPNKELGSICVLFSGNGKPETSYPIASNFSELYSFLISNLK